MIRCKNWILVERYKDQREKYEEYTSSASKSKIEFALTKTNETDIKILKLIHRMKIINSSQISKVVFKDTKYPTKYCNNHLKKLFELGCIDRFFPLTESGYPQSHVVLAPIGAKIIQIDNFKKITDLSMKWRHTVARSELFSNIFNKKVITEWKPELTLEWEERNNKNFIITDVFCGWISKDDEMFGMFEIDLGTEKIKQLQSKIKNYHKYFNSSEFKKANWQPYEGLAVIPKIIFVLNDEQRAESLRKFNDNFNSNVHFSIQTFDNFEI